MPAPTDLLVERFSRVQTLLRNEWNAPLLVTDPANVGWLSGIPADFQKDAHIMITPDEAFFITDGRYENRIPDIPGVKSFIWGASHPHRYPELKELLGGSKSLVLDTRGLALDIYIALPKMVGVKELMVPSGLVDCLRMIKGDLELKLIREAVGLTIRQFRYMLEEWLPANRDHATDMDLREALDEWPLQHGVDGTSFESIVAMDSDADTPHPDMTRPARPLKEGTIMLVDWGITNKGVSTDLTRMVVLGGRLPEAHERMKRLQEAWMAAVIERIKPGKYAHEAGNAYWELLKAEGIDKPFHGAGHGTGGAYVHELPVLSGMKPGVEDFGVTLRQGIVLEPGMVVTSEPGMYERGVGAYRTENMVLVTSEGNEILDSALSLEPFYI